MAAATPGVAPRGGFAGEFEGESAGSGDAAAAAGAAESGALERMPEGLDRMLAPLPRGESNSSGVSVRDMRASLRRDSSGRVSVDCYDPARRTAEIPAPEGWVYGRILLVEDDPSIREVTALGLQGAGFEVVTAVDGPEGLERFRTEAPDLVLLDVMLPGTSGPA
jgi:hypothetical protein